MGRMKLHEEMLVRQEAFPRETEAPDIEDFKGDAAEAAPFFEAVKVECL
jgi:hypothetical protein